MKIKYLENKKILMLGLGVTTYESSICLEEYKENITIVDYKLKDNAYKEKLESAGYKVVLEEEFLKEDIHIDIIMKSPGVSLENKVLIKYESVEITNDIELAYKYIKENLNTKIIAITGTNGKTSTTIFIEKFLQNAGYAAKSAGNIGVSPLLVLKNHNNLDYLVLEVSSFQLLHINTFKPDYSFILNITPDHLNMHPTFEHYVNAKKMIYKNQDENDFLFVKNKVQTLYLKEESMKVQVINNNVEVEVIKNIEFYNKKGINFNNLLLCYKLGNILGIDSKYYFKALNEFEGLEHRVEFVQCIDGINFYNDSKGTTLDATKESLKHLNNIILLVGGVSKGQDMSKLNSYLKNVKHVICYGQNKDEFVSEKITKRVVKLEDAVGEAKVLAKKGDNILLSPASASFDQYKNYKVRGKHFKRLIKEKW